MHLVVRMGRLELPQAALLEPKSSASTSSATFAHDRAGHYNCLHDRQQAISSRLGSYAAQPATDTLNPSWRMSSANSFKVSKDKAANWPASGCMEGRAKV
jgi:hypothetical protein